MAIKRNEAFAYHITQERERKNVAILELIRKRSPISRADLSRVLGFNIVTISNYTDYYIDKKIISEVGFDISSGGRRPELLELNAKNAYVVGVDLGPNEIKAVIADLNVNSVALEKTTRPPVRMEELAPEVMSIIDAVIKKGNIDSGKIKNIGIGISGIIDYNTGTIRDTDPTRGRTKANFFTFMKTIERRFNVSVYIGNDASCAAFGEKVLNPGADVENLLYLYSDIGCGIIAHGDVYIGSSGCAGEIQLALPNLQIEEENSMREYVYMRPWGVDLGLVFQAKKAIESDTATQILNLANGRPDLITVDTVIDAAKKYDKLAVGLIEAAGKNLGMRIAYLINFFNPSVVIIGGGVERAGDLLLDPIRESVKKFSFEEPATIVKIMPSLLRENAVVFGVAALAAREVFIQA